MKENPKLNKYLSVITPIVDKYGELVVCGDRRRCVSVEGNVLNIAVPDRGSLIQEIYTKLGPADWKLGVNYKVDLGDGIYIFIHTYNKENKGAVLLAATGNMLFLKIIRKLAIKGGMTLKTKGLFAGEHIIAGKTEEQIFSALGVPYIEPKERNITKNNKDMFISFFKW